MMRRSFRRGAVWAWSFWVVSGRSATSRLGVTVGVLIVVAVAFYWAMVVLGGAR
jgi:hypothetical protein